MEQKIVDIQKIISDYKIIEKSDDKGELFHLIKYAMKEACKQAIELAAENGYKSFWGMYDYHGDHDCFNLDKNGQYLTSFTDEDGRDVEVSIHFDKQSILDTINQIQ